MYDQMKIIDLFIDSEPIVLYILYGNPKTDTSSFGYFYGFEYKGTYYGDYELTQELYIEFAYTTSIVDTIIQEYDPHSVIPTESEVTFNSYDHIRMGYISQNVQLYPISNGEPECVDQPDCHRPCHKKFLREGGCSTSPQEQYNPDNYVDAIYPFWCDWLS